MGMIVLYKGNAGTQNIVITYTDEPGRDCDVSPSNEARSLKLMDVRAGCIIHVYNSKSVSTSDAWCKITVKQTLREYVVTTFQRSYSDDYVTVECFQKVELIQTGLLDGKVSHLRVD